MKRSGTTFALALSALTLASSATALTSEPAGNPYRGIVERNVFDIHAAAPAPPPDPMANRPPPPNIRLQGITDILGRKQVLFKVAMPAKPPMPAKEESFIMTVGEREGEIEVLAIDPKAGTVTMRNYGVETNLSLEFNSDKLVNVAPVAAPVGQPNPAQMTAPGAIAPPPTLPASPITRIPRTLRLPGQGNPPPNPFGGFGGSSVQAPTHEMSSEEAALILSANKLKAQQEGNPMSRIMPVPPALINEFQNNGAPTPQAPNPNNQNPNQPAPQ